MDERIIDPVAAAWGESLARSKAEILAGQAVPLLPLLERLRAKAERIEAEQGLTEDGVSVGREA